MKGAKGAFETLDGVTIASLRMGDRLTAVAANGALLRLSEESRIELVDVDRKTPPVVKVFIWSGPSTELPQFAALVKQSRLWEAVPINPPQRWPPLSNKLITSRVNVHYVSY